MNFSYKRNGDISYFKTIFNLIFLFFLQEIKQAKRKALSIRVPEAVYGAMSHSLQSVICLGPIGWVSDKYLLRTKLNKNIYLILCLVETCLLKKDAYQD